MSPGHPYALPYKTFDLKNLTLRESTNISPQDSGPLWRAGGRASAAGPACWSGPLCRLPGCAVPPFGRATLLPTPLPLQLSACSCPQHRRPCWRAAGLAFSALLSEGVLGAGLVLPWPRRRVWTNIRLFAARWPFPWSLITAAGVVLGLKDLLRPLPCTRAGPPCHHLGQGWCNRSGSTQTCVPAPSFNFSLKNLGPFWARGVVAFSLWTTSPLAVREAGGSRVWMRPPGDRSCLCTLGRLLKLSLSFCSVVWGNRGTRAPIFKGGDEYEVNPCREHLPALNTKLL